MKQESIPGDGMIEIPEHATWEDVIKKWPKETLLYQHPPIDVAKGQLDWMENIYQEMVGEKQRKI